MYSTAVHSQSWRRPRQRTEVPLRAGGQMKSMDAKDDKDPNELLTIPALAREYGIGEKTIRREAKRGSFPGYLVGTCWPRVRRREFERWIGSTRAPVSRHAVRRLEEVLEREQSSGALGCRPPEGRRKRRIGGSTPSKG